MAGITDFRKRRDERNGQGDSPKAVKQTSEEKGNAAAKAKATKAEKAKAEAEAIAKAEADEKAKTETVSEAIEPEFDPALFKND